MRYDEINCLPPYMKSQVLLLFFLNKNRQVTVKCVLKLSFYIAQSLFLTLYILIHKMVLNLMLYFLCFRAR